MLIWLDRLVDTRLVRTFVSTLLVIVQFRQMSTGLLLSELGAYLLSPARAAAGTKHLSNLLRCPKWHSSPIEDFLWQEAQTRLLELEEA